MFRQSLNLQGLIFHFCISKINYSIEFKIHFKTKTELTEERPLREGSLRFLTPVVFMAPMESLGWWTLGG